VSGAPHIAVVGGGLAGISAALACADAGARVSVFEARACLGGATFSTEKRGLRVDNGQHVFMRCCTAYRGLLARLGVDRLVTLQPRLAVPVAAPGRPLAWIRRHPLPAPAHLAPSLLGFPHLPLAARLRAARVARAFASLDPDDARLDERSLGSWLRRARGARRAVARVLGSPDPADAQRARGRRIARARGARAAHGLPRPRRCGGHRNRRGSVRRPARRARARALEGAGARVELRAAVRAVAVDAHGATLTVGGDSLRADAAILAAPPDTAAQLAPPAAGLDAAALARLGASPIVNLHVWFDRAVTDAPFVAGWDTPLQWIFDRTRAAGIDRGQLLTVSLSAAEEWIGKSRAELRAAFRARVSRAVPGRARGPCARLLRAQRSRCDLPPGNPARARCGRRR